MAIKFLSLFSGIEAASVAFLPLGMNCVGVAEIEKFPSSVLKHHYPETPNLGDVMAPDLIDRIRFLGNIDLLIGGPPCQAFSVAGNRGSLSDDRGNMTLRFVEIINEIEPKFIIFENVPGILSTKDNAFGCFLAVLVGADNAIVPKPRWTNAGMVSGPRRNAAWRVLDAQYFGLAQRRKRVFVVACPRNGADPREILFESKGVRRYPAEGGEEREDVTESATRCFGIGGDTGGGVSPTLDARAANGPRRGQGGVAILCDVSQSIAGPLGAGDGKRGWRNDLDQVEETYIAFDPNQVTSKANRSNPQPGDPCHPLVAGAAPLLTTSTGDTSHCLNAGGMGRIDYETETLVVGSFEQNSMAGRGTLGYSESSVLRPVKPQSDHQMIITHPITTGCAAAEEDGTGRGSPLVPVARGIDGKSGTLRSNPGSGFRSDGTNVEAVVSHGLYGVRRLTPTECERLQGFPDNYSALPKAADGPRYKALGNSMAVPVIAWLGQRIMEHYDHKNPAL